MDLDPSIIKPGWTPLIVIVLLAVVMVFLFLSMRRQFRKIRVAQDAATEAEESSADSSRRTTQFDFASTGTNSFVIVDLLSWLRGAA